MCVLYPLRSIGHVIKNETRGQSIYGWSGGQLSFYSFSIVILITTNHPQWWAPSVFDWKLMQISINFLLITPSVLIENWFKFPSFFIYDSFGFKGKLMEISIRFASIFQKLLQFWWKIFSIRFASFFIETPSVLMEKIKT